VPDHEQAAPRVALDVIRAGGIADIGVIEAVAVVGDGQAHRVGPELHTNPDDLARVFTVAVHDGVGECFGERGTQVEAHASGREGAGLEMVGDELDRVGDEGEIARDVEREFSGTPARAIGAANDEQRSHKPLKRGERFLGGASDREEGVKLGQLEQRLKILVQAGEAQVPALLANLLGQRHEHAQPR